MSSCARCACSRRRPPVYTAIDTVHTDFTDRDGLASAAAAAQRDGFAGKLAIHPDQVEILNRTFQPTPDAVGAAQAVVAAFAAAGGAGVVAHGGRMLDRPHLLRAQRVLALAAAVDAPAEQRTTCTRGSTNHRRESWRFSKKSITSPTRALAARSRRWAWFHLEVEGGVLINRIDDVRPGRSRQQHEDLVHRLRRVRHRTHRGHRPAATVAGDALRRAQRRSFLPARRLRLPRSRRLSRAPRCAAAATRAGRLSSATTASAS